MSKMPDADEFGFVKTFNNTGYMTTSLDEFSREWVKFARVSKGVNADIGAAYGVATLAALENSQAQVLAIDLDPGHLEVLKTRAQDIGASSRLQTAAGNFPDDFSSVENESLENILICRMLHFFNGPQLQNAIHWCFQKMRAGGRLVLVNETPYLKNFKSFIPIYEERKKRGDEFPGFIDEVKKVAPERAPFLPAQMHLLDEDVLRRVCKKAGFKIEKSALIARPEFPTDIQLDGRESVGVIALK